MGRSFDAYLREVGTHQLLTRGEEVELARRSRSGDEVARERLVAANLRFVVSVARRYRGRGVPLADLVNEGNLGLIRAAARFDETRGVRFISYAVWWIRQAMLQAIERERSGSGAEPGSGTLSLDDEFGDGGTTKLVDVVPDRASEGPEDRVLRHSLRDALDASLTFLPPREEQVLRLYFGLDGDPPMSLEQVGGRLGVTRERVRQIKDRGLARLRIGTPGEALDSHRR